MDTIYLWCAIMIVCCVAMLFIEWLRGLSGNWRPDVMLVAGCLTLFWIIVIAVLSTIEMNS